MDRDTLMLWWNSDMDYIDWLLDMERQTENVKAGVFMKLGSMKMLAVFLHSNYQDASLVDAYNKLEGRIYEKYGL